ncbi:DUF3581 family protein [Thalassotalea agarivorans]|uniref:DUF3581 domain-containing protein n=1 Tax=Thalassotalea agarivorans TaxID=349064 RepID=A0A1H9YBT7_THASX|nr:DUF3581 family protein [Thalassotalea agarivorans]SES66337.1 Protein of unknown function [Thalassotalea agarivorans]
MFLEQFFEQNDEQIVFKRAHGCSFAKQVANDFNPLHDHDAKRFVVPGDLLFAIVLKRCGIHQNMRFTFSGMVSDDTPLNFPTQLESESFVTDVNDKEYVGINCSGNSIKDDALTHDLIQAYVAFSGQTFPGMLVELMEENNVMINPARPMVMYENMSLTLDTFDIKGLRLETASTNLSVDGKRGKAILAFNIVDDAGNIVGHGEKNMLLSGLKPYCSDAISDIIELYNDRKQTYA